MKYLSVCSGIEAASVAWHGLGFEPVGFSEIEPFPSAVLAHRFPHVKNFGDMTKFKEWNLGSTIDILVGGTPCQSFSVAGLRKGLEDPRGNLMLTFGAIAHHFKPRFIVWENVPGVLSTNGGRDFGAFLGMLEECGYGFAYRVLDAQFFGVPQRRRRVFVVGCLGDWSAPAKILFEPESLRGDIAQSRKQREDTSGVFAVRTANTSANGHGVAENVSHTLARAQGQCVVMAQTQYGEKAGALTARHDSSPCSDRGQNIVVMAHGQANAEIRQDGQATTLTCNHEAPILAVEGFHWQNGFGASVNGDLCGTLIKNQTPAAQIGSSVRRLTPVECERLQGFPDNWTQIPWKAGRKKVEDEAKRLVVSVKKLYADCPDGPRYKACGNSMAVPVMRWIGERIKRFVVD